MSRATPQAGCGVPGRCRERVPERAFWSAVTSNPPLYGADTPTSFFDRQLPFGWNLRDLQVLKGVIACAPAPGTERLLSQVGLGEELLLSGA